MGIKAAAFDIDGTLYDERKFFLRQIPLVLRSPLLCWGYAKARKDVRRDDFYEPPLHREQAKRVLRALGRGESESAVQAMESRIASRIYCHWDRYFTGMRPFEAVGDTLKELKQQGYLLAAMSDFPVGNKLTELGLEEHFLFAFSAEDVGYLKPSRMPFMTLADELGCLPDEVLYVGNSMSKDIIGAKDAGMHTALFSSSPGKAARMGSEGSAPDILFSSYRDLPGEIAKLQQHLPRD